MGELFPGSKWWTLSPPFLSISSLCRVTLIARLPPRLTSFWIIFSQISSNFPFPPSLAGRLEQLKPPMCSFSDDPSNVNHHCVSKKRYFSEVTGQRQVKSLFYKITGGKQARFDPAVTGLFWRVHFLETPCTSCPILEIYLSCFTLWLLSANYSISNKRFTNGQTIFYLYL